MRHKLIVEYRNWKPHGYAKYRCGGCNWVLETSLHETLVTAPSLLEAFDKEATQVIKFYTEHLEQRNDGAQTTDSL
jgi:hypothetical protein